MFWTQHQYAFGGRNNKITGISIPSTFIGRRDTFYRDEWDRLPVTRWTLAGNITGDLSNIVPDTIYYNYIANGQKAGTYTTGMTSEQKEEGDWVYRTTQYGAVLGYYKGSSSRLRIPAELGGAAVKALTKGALGERPNSIINVLIPEGITYIGASVFAEAGLSSITIPASVSYIGSEAFSQSGLTALTFSGSPLHIGERAFSHNKLTAVNIPSGVKYIGDRAFEGNELTGLSIPSGVTHVGESAFTVKPRASVTFPASLATTGGYPLGGVDGCSFVLQSAVRVLSYDDNNKTLKTGRYTYVITRFRDGNRAEDWQYSAK